MEICWLAIAKKVLLLLWEAYKMCMWTRVPIAMCLSGHAIARFLLEIAKMSKWEPFHNSSEYKTHKIS
jgi:hypothetical protein